ncbi:MAG: hypothetical protein PHN84_03145 [Desulfuromonadaceae bacterium]|nr:hypothetical protein [Desulfuromonadaceae bacterium]MDD2854670.1 hypothetical protein [Desulfuromonadaceae bacterium]
MKISAFAKLLFISVMSCFLFACGGDKATPLAADTSTTLKGVAAAGIFQTGTVDIHAVKADGTLDPTPLNSANIVVSDNGNFSVNIGTYSGAVVAIAYGTYVDEATGATINLPKTSPLRAALPSSSVKSGVVKLNITALTTVAVAQAGVAGPAVTFTDNSIVAANQALATAFDIASITDVAPVSPTDLLNPAVSGDQIKYTTLLALLSEYTGKTSLNPAEPTPTEVVAALSNMATNIDTTNKTISSAGAYSLQSAASTLLAKTENPVVVAINQLPASTTYINQVKDGSLLNGGVPITIFPLKLRTVGPDGILGIDVAFTLPPGVSIFPNNTTGIFASGAAGGVSLVTANTVGQKTSISLATGAENGLAAGEFLTVYCGYSAGTAPLLADIIISDLIVHSVAGGEIVTDSFVIEKF